MSERDYEELHLLREQNSVQSAEIAKLRAELQAALKTNEQLTEQLKSLNSKLDVLLQQFKNETRRKYGKKTEKHNPRPAPPAEPIAKPRKYAQPKERNHSKHILAQNLPTEHVHHYVDDAKKICPACLVETKRMRDEITHQLDRITQTLKKLEHHQEVRSCPKCKQYVVTADKPVPPIPGSYVAPRLLAHVIVSKLAYGLPLHRQEKMLCREGTKIPRSTQCDWMLAAADLLEQVWELLKADIKKSAIIKTDDTEIGIQDPSRKDGSLRKGKMTPYIGDPAHPGILFDFSPNMSFARNRAFFKDFAGIIQADAAGGWQTLFADATRRCAGCHAHSRRKYFEYAVINKDDPDAAAILDIYYDLYRIEAAVADMAPEVRLAMRRRKSKPLIKKLRSFLITLQGKYPPTNGLMKAAGYTLNHWIPLTRFLKNGALDIDNNSCERVIKDFVLTRKNFLFVGSDRGGRAAAILLTFIATCVRLDIDPVEYFTDVFERINNMKVSELPSLLPMRWKELIQSKVS